MADCLDPVHFDDMQTPASFNLTNVKEKIEAATPVTCAAATEVPVVMQPFVPEAAAGLSTLESFGANSTRC